jgi:hypothetical protein
MMVFRRVGVMMERNRIEGSVITWIRWYVSDIIAIRRLINTITETSI